MEYKDGARPLEARRPARMGRVHFAAHAPVAQLDRALPSGGRGQRFESSRARHLLQAARLQPAFSLIFAMANATEAPNVYTFVHTFG